jgi:hypothetical protein
MCGERPVDSDEAQILDLALSEKKPVERIARCGLWFDIRQHMAMIYYDELKSHAPYEVGEQRERHRKRELSQPRFDGDFPQTSHAYMH